MRGIMSLGKLLPLFKFLSITLIAGILFVSGCLGFYLKFLPAIVSDKNVIQYVENIIQKAYYLDVEIKNPVLKTAMSPTIEFGVDEVLVKLNKQRILGINDFKINLSLNKILNKRVVINDVNLDYIYADVNKIIELPMFKQAPKKEEKSDWLVDIFSSKVSINKAEILYGAKDFADVKLLAKDIKISDDSDKKYIKYLVFADIIKGKNIIHIETSDNNNVYIKNKEKIIIDGSDVLVDKSHINIKGFVDDKYNYNVGLTSKKFPIPAVIDLLNSQVVENNLAEQLVYFNDINGDFDFNFNLTNTTLNGKIDLNKLSFKFNPMLDLPILLNSGKVTIDSNSINLKDFKGYYNNKISNKMDFEGSVKDYLKSVDTDLVGNAVITNDFARSYLSKIFGYPIGIEGIADTRVMLKSKYNKIDLVWLARFKKGNGFIVDGEESFMNDAANRVMAAKMHFDKMLLNIESLSYYAGNPENKNPNARIPIFSVDGNIDFSDGKTYVKDLGLDLPKPMPSGLINALVKQKIFKNGTFTGKMKVVNTGKYPVLHGSLKAEKVAIPSLRLFVKNGEFSAENGLMHIKSDGRYRRSAYDLSGAIVNELKFPIIVKNITLSVDNIDVERYLKIFNAQQPTTAATNLATVIDTSKSNINEEEDDDDDEQVFDLANLIIEECILKVQKGFYKDIHFSDVVANLTLDKNSLLKISSNMFDIAEGRSNAKINCDLKNHKYFVRLGIKEVNSDIIATSLLNLSKEISGKASGLIELNTDDSLKLNGRIQFRIYEGTIGKVGLVEYVMKVASLFRNPLTMISPSVVSDLVTIPEGKFNQIDGDLRLKDNIVTPMIIKSTAPQLSSFIVGTYDLEHQDAALRIYTKFSNRKKGLYGLFRNLSLNSLANRIPLSSRNDSNYYESEIAQIPEIDADEKDCQIFLTKVDGDVEHNNFISSLKKIK